MARSSVYLKTDYLENSPVYCFKEIYLEKEHSVRKVNKYYIGDFIPVVSERYIYNHNLLIVDAVNKIVHVIDNCIYVKKINFKEDIDEFLRIKLRCFMVIDLYGRLIKVNSILRMYAYMGMYPKTDTYFEVSKYSYGQNVYAKTGNLDVLFAIKECFCYERHLSITGSIFRDKDIFSKEDFFEVVKGNPDELDISFSVGSLIKDQAHTRAMELFLGTFEDVSSIYYISNKLLDLIFLLKLCSDKKLHSMFFYYDLDNRLYTHVDRIKNSISDIILSASSEQIENSMDWICCNIDDEDYFDFIICAISDIVDIF